MNEETTKPEADGATDSHGINDLLSAIVSDTAEVLDSAVNAAGDLVGTDKASRLAGGAMVGAAASLLLPVSLVGGALFGVGYAAVRNKNR